MMGELKVGVAGKYFIINASTFDLVQLTAFKIHLGGKGGGERYRREGSVKTETCFGGPLSIALRHST